MNSQVLLSYHVELKICKQCEILKPTVFPFIIQGRRTYNNHTIQMNNC